INLPLTNGLAPEAALALAAAERGDVTFYALDTDGVTLVRIDPDDTTQTAVQVRVARNDDVNVTLGSGVLTVDATDDVNIGPQEQIAISRVTAGGEVRLKSQDSLTNGRSDTGVNIQGGDLILEAEDHGIGSAAKRILTDIVVDRALTARAHDGVYLSETSGDLLISSVFAGGVVELKADGSILDAFDDDGSSFGPDWNVNSSQLSLQAGTGGSGSVGSTGHVLETDLQGGLLRVLAPGSVFVHELAGDLAVD